MTPAGTRFSPYPSLRPRVNGDRGQTPKDPKSLRTRIGRGNPLLFCTVAGTRPFILLLHLL